MKKKIRGKAKKIKTLSGWGNISNVHHTLLLLHPPFICLSDPIKKVWKRRENGKTVFWWATPQQMYYSPPQCTTMTIIDCASVRNCFLRLDDTQSFLLLFYVNLKQIFRKLKWRWSISIVQSNWGTAQFCWILFLSNSHSLFQRGVFVCRTKGRES